ncbi:hypothetical protein Q2T40_19100 [Winogradskyella maritima]|uniref:Uncharacterized protein n=1 Tax=Winogradskyella maritima TaxID=1517766 RepID=A0ABV8AHE6_9FLAO|nr:hypothetical protein [Winogradskyella maritima]
MKKERIAINALGKSFEKVKFFTKIVFSKTLGVSVAILLNSSCKADGG